MPSTQDYYEPWTYDYDQLFTKISWSANWDDDLAGGPGLAPADPVLRKPPGQAKLEFERAFMFYLPRICEHCLNPSCVASCPSGALYMRSEDGIVLVDQDRCRGWRMCVTGCPYKKVYFGRDRDESIASAVGMSGEQAEGMHRLPALAPYDERYVIPKAHAEQGEQLKELATGCSLDYEGGGPA